MKTFHTTKRVKRFVFSLFLPAALFLAGCPYEKYTLKLSMQKDVLHRELVVQGMEKVVPEEEIANLEKIYQQKVQRSAAQNHSYTFTGRFTGTTPDDVGGNGSALYYSCSLGSFIAYTETFRGNDDTAVEVEDRLKAVNRMVDFLRGWLKYEFGKIDDFPKLDAFLNTTARQDAKSLALYWWLLQNSKNKVQPGSETIAQAASQPTSVPASLPAIEPTDDPEHDPQATVAVRMIQYILSRKYVSLECLPKIMDNDFWGFSHDVIAKRDFLLRHILTNKVGLVNDGQLTAALLKILAHEKSLKSSLIAYFKTTPEYEKTKKTLEARASTQPATAPTTQPANPEEEIPSAYLMPIVESIMGSAYDYGVSDHLYITFLLPPDAKILRHNGKHDSKNHRVLWRGAIPSREKKYSVLPGICYAAWAAPNKNVQKKRFGKVVLTGDDLAGYIGWCKTLPAEKQKQWNTFLETLTPAGAPEAILTFRFDGDKMPTVHAGHDGSRILYRAVSGQDPPAPATQPSAQTNGNDPCK